MAEVEVQVLGALRVLVDGAEIRLGGRRERVVLGVLAAAGGRPVTAERLVDEVWGEEPPPSATGSLQVAVSRLRSLLEPDRAPGVTGCLTRGAAGYSLTGVALDAARFTAAATAASRADDPERRLLAAEEALALWRGTPYADLADVPSLAAEATQLVERRLGLEELRAESLLALDRPAEAQSLLAPLLRDHPFRERLWGLSALALYRCDRQAEALEVLRRLRTALVDELGVDPSPATRALEEAVLTQADHLVPARKPPPATAAIGGVVPPRSRAAATGRRVVGRGDLLPVLHRRAGELARGRGGAVVLTGEAGIGKSVLVGELAAAARDLGVTVLVGQCHEAELAPAYWPWLPVLRDLADEDAPPEVRAMLGDHDAERPVQVVDAGASALRTFDAVSRVLRAVPGPLLVVLEDVHWADASSLRLLAYAADALAHSPVLFVVTTRPLEPHQQPALTSALAALARAGADRLRVPPLERAEIRELLADLVAEPSAALIEALARRTDGNPFFVLELAAVLSSQGGLTAAAAHAIEVPDGVADVLRMRLLALSDAAREVVTVASVAGREFDASLLADALGRPVLDEIDEALGGGVLQSTGDGRYRFVHALTRETAYGDIPAGRRARWHAAIGRALRARLEADPDVVAEVAHHHLVAATHLPELLDTAVGLATRAARDAERRGAFDEAFALWTRAAEVERRSPVADPQRRHRLTLALATARQRIGDMQGMVAALHDAIAAARARGDHDAMAEAATGFRSSGVWYWREMGSKDTATLTALHEALEHVTDQRLLARLWGNLAAEYFGMWRSAEARGFGKRSLELARTCGDRDVLLNCLANVALCLWIPGAAPPEEHEAVAREMLAQALEPEDEITASIHLAVALHHQARVAESDEAIERALAIARELRHTNCDVPLAWWRWMRALESADPDAEELAQAAVDLHRRTTMMSLQEGVALVLLETLPLDQPVPADTVALGRRFEQYAARVAVGHALARRGEVGTAREVIGPLPPADEHDYATLWGVCRHGDVFAMAGDRDGLEEVLRRIEPHASTTATFGSVLSDGATALYVGAVLAGLGRLEEARAAFARAREIDQRAGLHRWVAEVDRRVAALDPASADGKDARTPA